MTSCMREHVPGAEHEASPKGRGESEIHLPLVLQWEQRYGASHVVDERGFEMFDPSVKDPQVFERDVVRDSLQGALEGYSAARTDHDVVRECVQSLGRMPTPAEVRREQFRRKMFQQIQEDSNNPLYVQEEVAPQQAVIKKRAEDFPAPEHALEAFRDGNVRIEHVDGVERLIIEVPNADGELVEHPVMTDEEIEWVRKSADVIARTMERTSDSRVFIAGLGLGLLNKELVRRGIDPKRQVVAELNTQVIAQVGGRLAQEFGQGFDLRQGASADVLREAREHGETFSVVSMVHSTERVMDDGMQDADRRMDIRQGDFKAVLQDAVDRGEQFDAISIDAFPNTADEVNRDASSRAVLELALRALKPGGLLTFYPDSRYIPKRIWDVLHASGIPDSSMNYTVARFKTSEFTQSYHYGELMAVVHIQKPLIERADDPTIDAMVDAYYVDFEQRVQEYVEKHRGDAQELAAA